MTDDTRPPKFIKHKELKEQRDKLRAEGRCINGPRDPNKTRGRSRQVEHGPVVHGGKCQRCLDVAAAGRPKKRAA